MCTDFFSVSALILGNLLPEAEAVSPGHGCELLSALIAVSDAAMIAGFVAGLFAALVAQDILRFVRNFCYRRSSDVTKVVP